MAGGDFLPGEIAFLDQHLLEPEKPFLVIGARQVHVRRQRLAIEARGVDVEGARRAHRAHHGENTRFPLLVKHRLVWPRPHPSGPPPSPPVVDAVHEGAPGVLGKPVPIMESRVTSSASCSSLQPSVPAGRIGSTRKRVSAVESQTRISMSLGSVTSKSASTPRGSFTARER